MTAYNKIIWIYDVVQVTDLADGTKRLQGIIVNITERKNMENALIPSEKLKSIGTITAGIYPTSSTIFLQLSSVIYRCLRKTTKMIKS